MPLPHLTCTMPLLPIFPSRIAFQSIFLAWSRLPRTSTEPRRVIGNTSGKLILRTELCLTRRGVELTPQIINSSSNPVAGL